MPQTGVQHPGDLADDDRLVHDIGHPATHQRFGVQVVGP